MKKLIVSIVMLASVFTAYAGNPSNYTKEGNIFKTEKVQKSSTEEATGFLWEDSKGNQYTIYIGPSGACYVHRISQKTGKQYKYYLGEDISKDICKSLGKEYKPSK